jgi:serine/threonine protein kinase
MADFGGRYQLVSLLGEGSMGQVWLALDEELHNRPVAIKVMKSYWLRDPAGVARFQQELGLAAKMQHPNIVTLFTSGVENEIPFMVMEYLQGHDLAKVPDGWGAAEIARAGRETCAALAYAHECNVVHRDIKPRNLFALRDTGFVKVTDFGIAKALTESNAGMPGTLAGTPVYMAPEQWLGEPATFAIDIWATGCSLYELLSGKLPRQYSQPVEYIAAAGRGEPVRALKDVAREVPSWLADAVMAMLESNPADRPTAAECRELLTARPKPVPQPQPSPHPQSVPKPFPSTGSASIGPKITFDPASQPLKGLPTGSVVVVHEFAFSPDGRLLAVAVNKEIRFWDTATGHAALHPLPIEGGGAAMMTFTPDGRYLIARLGASNMVACWDIATGQQTGPTVGIASSDASKRSTRELTISPDARFLAMGIGPDVLLWDIANGSTAPRTIRKGLGMLRSSGSVLSDPAFPADGSRLALSLGGDVHVWETGTRRRAVHPLKQSRGDVKDACFSPDGRFIATRVQDVPAAGERIWVWDISEERPEAWQADDQGGLGDRPAMRFAPGGRVLAGIEHGGYEEKGQVHLWDVTARKPLGKIPNAGFPSFSPDGATMAATWQGKIRLWNTATLQDSPSPLADPAAGAGGHVKGMAFSPDWRLMATELWRTNQPPLIRLWRSRPVLYRTNVWHGSVIRASRGRTALRRSVAYRSWVWLVRWHMRTRAAQSADTRLLSVAMTFAAKRPISGSNRSAGQPSGLSSGNQRTLRYSLGSGLSSSSRSQLSTNHSDTSTWLPGPRVGVAVRKNGRPAPSESWNRARMPSSSKASRSTVSRGSSPSSTCPPDGSHSPDLT